MLNREICFGNGTFKQGGFNICNLKIFTLFLKTTKETELPV